MNKTLQAIFNKYGAENTVVKLLEQLSILTNSEDEGVKSVVKEFYKDFNSDTEYLYSLCEYTNLVTYTSGNRRIFDNPWAVDADRLSLLKEHKQRINMRNKFKQHKRNK